MPVDEIRIALQSNATNLSFIWFKLHKKWNLSYNSIDCISFQDEPNWNESFLFKTFPMQIKPVALIAKTRIIARFFSGVTILLSLTVFLNLVAETLPQVSDAIPLLGTTCYRVFTEFFFPEPMQSSSFLWNQTHTKRKQAPIFLRVRPIQ